MDRSPAYLLIPGPSTLDDDGSWLIVRDGETYAELRGTPVDRARHIVDTLNVTRP